MKISPEDKKRLMFYEGKDGRMHYSKWYYSIWIRFYKGEITREEFRRIKKEKLKEEFYKELYA